MEYSAFFWLLLNVLSTVVLAFYSMIEMACVSFNKVRLQYYVTKGYKRALWLNYLLQHPARLFGTTLIGVNIALVIGSECSREFYSSLGLSPDLAPLTQVVFIVIFGELAPMFAARRYPEHVVMLGIPLLYASAKLMTPFLIIIDWISKAANFFIGGKDNDEYLYLTQEELQKVLEEQGEDLTKSESDEFSAITASIFSLRGKDVRQVMEPIDPALVLSSNATIEEMEALLKTTDADFVPIYHPELTTIVGIIYPRDVLRASESKRVRDFAWPPWFVTETTSLMQILKQFRTNNENVAVIINQHGKAIGIVTLDAVVEELLGSISYQEQKPSQHHLKNLMLVEKTFPGSMTVGEFNAQYGVLIDQDPASTLSEVIAKHLGHHPEKGDTIFIAPFELTVKDTSFTDIKTVSISTSN